MKNQLKVSIIVWNLSANDGIIRACLISTALEKIGYKTKIIGFTYGDGIYKATPNDIEIVTFPGKPFPGALNFMKQALAEMDGDIIYSIKPQLASFGISLLKKFLTQQKLILDIDDWEMSWHGGDDWKYNFGVKKFINDLFKANGSLRYPNHPLYTKNMERLVGVADIITTHNTFLKQRFGGRWLPNGKDTELFNPENYNSDLIRKELDLSEYKIIMFPGAPRPYKGVEDVLTALDQLDDPSLRFVIVGGSPYDDYDQHLHHQWGRWIIQLPAVNYKDMPRYIAAAHLVVVPQRNDPATRAQFPLKITDGMAMAKPVLATTVGDIPEILGDTGYLVPPGQPQAIAQAIKEIFNDYNQAIQIAKKSRIRCQEYYSLQSMSEALKEILLPTK